MDGIGEWAASHATWEFLARFVAHPLLRVVRLVKRRSPYKTVEVCLRHRLNAKQQYYEQAFVSGADVLYVSLMSEGTIKAIRPHLDECRRTNTRLRVLTWHHGSNPEAVETFRRHLDEARHEPSRTLRQLQQALEDWRTLEGEYKDILTIREYRSSPTMQGVIVSERWALIELLPYATHPDQRPALLLKPKTDPDLFALFKGQFERLWRDAE